ncbi:N-acetylglucosamine-6-phosphate deacetylase [Phyllobacterium myrsinacearum]|uniref:N-acetylglucosamine-6-phosphate deacetylase n=1 Tax=Phyllobacterium myrsinacearum TaxID=28101 RepID=A0A839EKF9_9HYPH|nr:amidohydrolase family protein [Phyllobacterium myrsinacearum]MBA8879352.1 N-acetylglucosamine-6-phosphate deacetylase [Phyllobacterium myrsinacearum]
MITGGLVDIQVNGFAGVDFNSSDLTPEVLDHALEVMLATGVTTCLPTIITAYPDELEARFTALDRCVNSSRLGPLMCPGYHLEGPFLNPAQGFSGCHPAGAMTAADPALVTHLQSKIKRPILLTTVAPEISGGLDFIRAMAAQSILVSIGHSSADFAMVEAAVQAGATMSTHLGNGLPQSLPKLDNPLFAQLGEDRLLATFIADGIHLPPKALKSLIRAKGFERSALVTDAVAAAAVPAGTYDFAGMRIERTGDGMVRLPGTTGLAGSSLRLDEAVRNLVRWNIASFEQAIEMASTRLLGALAPALRARKITLPHTEIEWSDSMAIRSVRIGRKIRNYN